MTDRAASTARAGRSHDGPQASLPWPAQRVKRAVWRGPIVTGGERDIPEEIPVAFT
jgi:hypothetical protein